MTTAADGIPHALLHNLKHNKVLHERVLLLTVKIEDVPYVEEEKTFHLEELGQGFYRLIVRYGFMQETDVPARARPGRQLRPAVQDDGHQLLPRPPDPDRLARSPAWRSGARNCSPGCCATRKARWNSSTCRPTASSSSAARSRFERRGRRRSSSPPLFGDGDNGWLQELRRTHYPRRAQPGARPSHPVPPAAAEPGGRARDAARAAPPPRRRRARRSPASWTWGRGRRFRVESEELEAIRDGAGRGLSRPADAAGPGALAAARHHPEQGRAARGAGAPAAARARRFEPRPLAIRALASWRYLDGPWERLKVHPFRR